MFSGFLFSSHSHFSPLLVILLLFYFCHHMLSQLSHSLSTLPPAALCLCHHLRVRNRIKLPPSNFGICEFGDTRTHTCTVAHAPAEECSSLLHPLCFLSLLSSLLIHLLLHAQPSIFTSVPPAFSLSLPLFSLRTSLCLVSDRQP